MILGYLPLFTIITTVILFYNTEWWLYCGMAIYKGFIILATGGSMGPKCVLQLLRCEKSQNPNHWWNYRKMRTCLKTLECLDVCLTWDMRPKITCMGWTGPEIFIKIHFFHQKLINFFSGQTDRHRQTQTDRQIDTCPPIHIPMSAIFYALLNNFYFIELAWLTPFMEDNLHWRC